MILKRGLQTSSIQKLKKSYDYIIVGSGTAGCLLANRLVQSPSSPSVLLVEAGGNDVNPLVHIPIGYLFAMDSKFTSWRFRTTNQPGLNNKSIVYPRGKVMGGCSAINGMIYMRGNNVDFEAWKTKYDNPSWTLDSVSSSYSSLFPEQKVENQRLAWDILEDFRDAAIAEGFPVSPKDEFFHSNKEHCGYFLVNQKRGVRYSAKRAFVNPVKNKLDILTNSTVEKVILEKDRVNGIKVNGEEIEAEKEVILSAGAIGSPHLLQVSGIGPKDVLENAGVKCIKDLPGVGENLHDHLQIRSVFKLKEGTTSLNTLYHSIFGKLKMGLEYIFNQSGPLSMAPSQFGLFASSRLTRDREQKEIVDLQFHVQPVSMDSFQDPVHRFPGMTVSVCNLKPSSRGSVRLTSPDIRDAPKIDPNYLDTDDDRKVAAEALRLARRLMRAEAMGKYLPEEYFPGAEIESDEDLATAAGDISTSIFHPVGTCLMSNSDPKAVVDENLKVHGVEGLRVVDASIMPEITAGNTNTPTLMIAQQAANRILKSNN
eukprot:snap_masked-scaffold_1-processed-gene-15.19-mRNA-1 protein AED:0.01 eAED:0.01 QI:0/-1/0/1/-1/1/1/0/538